MDKKNKLSSYIDPSAGHSSPFRSQGKGQIVPADTSNLDAVANYNNYAHNKPSNPRNSTPRRADRTTNTLDETTQESTARQSRLLQQKPQPPRLTYYNEGESPSGRGGFKETPKQVSSAANRSRRNNNNGTSSPNDRRAHQPDYTNPTQINRNADLVDSRPHSARRRHTPQSTNDRSSAQVSRDRGTGLVVTPGPEDTVNQGSFDDYVSPAKQPNGRYSVGNDENTSSSIHASSANGRRRSGDTPESQPASSRRHYSRPATRASGPAQFLVRVHRVRDAFSDFEEAGRPKPTTFISVHTTEERGRTGVVAADYHPVFNDEFLFTSSRPDKDALVVTLVVAAPQSQRPNRRQSTARDKKVAEAIISLQNLERGVERERWVTLVRHSGTPQAYERGEVLISIVSEEYGQDLLPTEEEEGVYYDEVHDMLMAHAPEELHRLDWFVGNVSREGPEGLSRLRAKMIERTLEPVKVRLTVSAVSGLTAPDGRPTQAETCYVVISTPKGSEMTTKTVPYHRRASFDQTFVVTIRHPDVDAVSLAVFSAGRKLGEAQVGLANLQAGISKEVSLMLVRAAETGDAAPAGEMTVVLQTESYSSPYQMSATREARVRERVTAYLWCYLRDDLHRVDAIVAGIDDEDAYMKEWARTIGPERKPKNASLRIGRIKDVFGTSGEEANDDANRVSVVPPRVYMRVVVGPKVYRTETASVRNGEVSFRTALDVVVYDPKSDSVELMLIEESERADKEISRVVLGTAGLPLGTSVTRHVKLVTNALLHSARTQGEMEVELVAHDFGVAADAAITDSERYRYLCDRLQGVTERNNPESLHRVPYMIDTAPPGKVEAAVARKTKEFGTEVASAPMTMRILGLKEFRGPSDCYVKAYLDGNAILCTRDTKGGAEVTFDIADNNECTVQLTNASQARLVFKIGQHHPCKRTTVIARTELALRSMVRGEKNTVWIPVFEGSADYFHPEAAASNTNSKNKRGAGSAANEPFRGSRMPTAHSPYGAGSARPLGKLGVMVQSNAFPGTTVTEYVLDSNNSRGGSKGKNANTTGGAYEAVTRDVTSLLMKFRPQDLPKVQPLIAECSSLKEAHRELRTRFCTRPVGATVYVNIEKIELSTADGRVQEEQCGVRADISYGDERQSSIKKREFENDVIHQSVHYSTVRLDIPDPQNETAALAVVSGASGVSSQRRARAGATSASTMTAPPLEIRLVGVRPGSNIKASAAAASGLSPLRQRQDSQHRDGADNSMNNRSSSTSPRRHNLGGKNNLTNYLDDSAAAALNPPADTTNADSPYAHGSRNREDSFSPSRQQQLATVSAASMVMQGEMGLVQLSLRARLSSPLHKPGDTIRVPIVCPPRVAEYGQTTKSSLTRNARNIVGHVTLRVTLPAFESVPEWLRLASRTTLVEVNPKYVHYYERRIGAYLRENSPADLVDFHYKLYERDVATGRWPTSLYDWIQALVKRFGPETTNTFGPEPPLPFDPEERQRQLDMEQTRLRESAFADSVAGSNYGDGSQQPAGGWLGEDSYYYDESSIAGVKANAPADDIYEEKAAPHKGEKKAKKSDSPAQAEGASPSPSKVRETHSDKAKKEEAVYSF